MSEVHAHRDWPLRRVRCGQSAPACVSPHVVGYSLLPHLESNRLRRYRQQDSSHGHCDARSQHAHHLAFAVKVEQIWSSYDKA